MSRPLKHDSQWAKAKQVCRLNLEDIQMAKELSLAPKTLMKNQPSPSQLPQTIKPSGLRFHQGGRPALATIQNYEQQQEQQKAVIPKTT
jgi:hypothetical protein